MCCPRKAAIALLVCPTLQPKGKRVAHLLLFGCIQDPDLLLDCCRGTFGSGTCRTGSRGLAEGRTAVEVVLLTRLGAQHGVSVTFNACHSGKLVRPRALAQRSCAAENARHLRVALALSPHQYTRSGTYPHIYFATQDGVALTVGNRNSPAKPEPCVWRLARPGPFKSSPY